MSHEHDLFSIEQVIRRAKEQRAKDTAKIWGPALKRLGGLARLAVVVPWQLARHVGVSNQIRGDHSDFIKRSAARPFGP
jgi:hypothetical protein